MKKAPLLRHPRPTATLLAAILLLGASSASAQVGRYNAEERLAQQKKLEQKQAAARCASTLAKDQMNCQHYSRAVQPPQPDQPAREIKGAPKPDGILFPGATRASPQLEATKSGGKSLNAIIALSQAKQYPQAIQQAEALAAASSNAYERGFAYQLAANASADSGDNAKAAGYFKQALDSNGLNNDDHYQVMYNLAVTQYQTKRPADALATLERLTTETKSQAPEYTALKAGALAELNRPHDAAVLYEQAYARDPGNTKALMNAAAAYQQANEFAKANALLAAAQQKGALTDASQYRALYVGYLNDNKPKDAVAVIDAGLAKGVLKPSPELAQAYSIIAQTAYEAGDVPTTIAMYQRAASMATDGEAALNLARVLYNEKRLPESRLAAQQALQKGVKAAAEAQKLAGQTGK